jgi:hypothetical protein
MVWQRLYRELHQNCAIPDYKGLEVMCEPRLAARLRKSLENIHFHGMDMEMANLRVD